MGDDLGLTRQLGDGIEEPTERSAQRQQGIKEPWASLHQNEQRCE